MKGIHFHISILRVLRMVLFCGLLMQSSSLVAAIDTILIVKSSDNRFFNTTIEQLITKTKKQVKFHITSVTELQQHSETLKQAQVIVTMGINATREIKQSDINIPVIHSYLTEFQYRNNTNRANHHAVLLDQPLSRYIKFIQALLTVDSVGIIKKEQNQIKSQTLTQLQKKLDINIDQVLFRQGDNPVNTVRNLLEKNDVLLSLPEPDVYNRRSLKGILLTSYRQNKPFISYSPAHVKSGALAAIYSSPQNIGDQLARIVNSLLTDNKFKPEPFYYASDFNISINQSVADSLGLDLPNEQDITEKLKQERNQ